MLNRDASPQSVKNWHFVLREVRSADDMLVFSWIRLPGLEGVSRCKMDFSDNLFNGFEVSLRTAQGPDVI